MRLRKNKIVGIIMIVLIMFVFFLNTNIIEAAINSDYGTNYVPDNTSLDKTIEDSTLLDLIGHLVFAVGRVLEWILGAIFTAISGQADFPWADKIVFNAIPILDVNFINPDTNSFVGVVNIRRAISNIYATIFSIAFTFFGSFAVISAIKLAISTIAEQKAKYKQALVDWCMGFVMLFCIHYFMSFIFYLNEQLVETASTVAKEAVETAGVNFQLAQGEMGGDLISRVKDWDQDKGEYLEEHSGIVDAWVTLAAEDDSDGLMEAVMKNEDVFWDYAIDEDEQYENVYRTVKWIVDKCPSVEVIDEVYDQVFYFQQNDMSEIDSSITKGRYSKMNFEYLRFPTNGTSYDSGVNEDNPDTDYTLVGEDTFNTTQFMLSESMTDQVYGATAVGASVFYPEDDGSKGDWVNGSSDSGRDFLNDCELEDNTTNQIVEAPDNWNYTRLLEDIRVLKAAATNTSAPTESSDGSVDNLGSPISSLGEYFKLTSYEAEFRSTNVTGVTDEKSVNIVNAIMYAVLVAQSLILFIAYVKRLFYIIILGMISPVVVSYDFFRRFGK